MVDFLEVKKLLLTMVRYHEDAGILPPANDRLIQRVKSGSGDFDQNALHVLSTIRKYDEYLDG